MYPENCTCRTNMSLSHQRNSIRTLRLTRKIIRSPSKNRTLPGSLHGPRLSKYCLRRLPLLPPFQSDFLGLPCAECLQATGDDLTLTPDTDPLWRPNPAHQPLTTNQTHRLSLTCRWAIRYYLHAVAPVSNKFPCTMFRMCIAILEFGPTAIRCLEDDYPFIAHSIFGQFIRCQFARYVLGEDWGTEKAEKSKFVDSRTNRTLGGIDFIRDGFLQLSNQTGQGDNESS